jgi:hypothetical protein
MNINNIFSAFNEDFEDEETEMLIDFIENYQIKIPSINNKIM